MPTKTAPEPGTAIATIREQYPVLDPKSDAAELIQFNLGGEGVNIADLDRVKVPGGGGLSWEVPTYNGAESQKAIEGILIHVARRRAYWSNPNPSNTPPDCTSQDMETGTGKPGGDCSVCPLNQWGSAKGPDGSARKGKGCRERLLMFILRPGKTLPLIVSVPPTSLKPIRQYRLRLADAGKRFFAVQTRLTLLKKSNDKGTAYSEIVPEVIGDIDSVTAAAVEAYSRSLLGAMESAADTLGADDAGE
jgi:hypothetical protein